MQAFTDAVEEATYCPVSLEASNNLVILLKCCHRLDLSVAIELFGALNRGQATKVNKCPVCRASVEGYVADQRLTELAAKCLNLTSDNTTVFGTRALISHDLSLLELGAANGNANCLYLLGEHYFDKAKSNSLAVKHYKAAVFLGQPAAKLRLFKIFIEEQLDSNTIPVALLKSCIEYQTSLNNSQRTKLGNLIENGIGLDKPNLDLAMEQYLISLKQEDIHAIPCILRILPKISNKNEVIGKLVESAKFLISELSNNELITMTEYVYAYCSNSFENFLNAVPIDLKCIDLALYCEKNQWKSPLLAKALSSDNKAILRKLALIYLEDHKTLNILEPEAVALFEKSEFPDNILPPHQFLADFYYNNGHFDKAKQKLLISIKSNESQYFFQLGKIYERESNYTEADRYYLLAAEKNHTDAMCIINTENWLKNAVQLGSTHALVALAHHYISLEQFTELEQLLVGNQHLPEGKVLLGVCYLQGICFPKDLIQAATLFQSASTDLALSQVALGYLQAEEIDNAKEFYSKIKKDTKDLNLRLILGQLCEKLNLSEAFEHYLHGCMEGDRKSKKRIVELFLKREIVANKIPLNLFKEGIKLLNPNIMQKSILAIYLCTGRGLDNKDIDLGLNFVNEAIQNKNFGLLEFMADLFFNKEQDKQITNKAYIILSNNKMQYLAGKDPKTVFKFLKEAKSQGRELLDWIVCIKERAKPSFLETLSDYTELNEYSISLRIEAQKKKLSSKCTLI